MDRERRRQRVHLLQQAQQIAFFKQSVELRINQPTSCLAYLFSNDRIRVEIALFAEIVIEIHSESVLTHHTLQLLDHIHQRHVKLRRIQNLEVIARILHERHQRRLHQRIEQLRFSLDLHRCVV